MRTLYLEGHNVADCCGCRACEQACPPKAITMSTDAEGFIYPHVDLDICINCGLCSKVCPIDNAETAKNKRGNFYVVVNKNHEELMRSSSGGVFTAIAGYVLSKEGVVYGAAFQEGLVLQHIRVNTKEGLEKLRGSKYLQSNTADVYSQVRQDLRNGKLVYFVGTGCQVAGLKLFLKKNYDNLVTSDLVCHGTPSQKMFDIFVEQLQKKRHLILDGYKFRDKRVNGWSCSSSSSSSRNKTVWYDKIMNAYSNVFLSGAIDRESCYECPFACGERCGDITLADYWSVRKHHPSIDYQYGVSCISVNTEKGKQLLNILRPLLILEESKYEWAVDDNYNLQCKTLRPKERDNTYKEAFENPMAFIRKYTDKDDLSKRTKFELRKLLKRNEEVYQFLRTIKKTIHP